ncbi:MAG: molybdopterin molybdotransferase MoeA [Planctomycetes bacterium]|nr:molybdopterin molybdotransferase MoeA [Planctomycetota bacterium]
MLSVREAQAKVRERIRPLTPESWPLSCELLGLQLAEDVVSDLDMPPFDKALMDGFAVRSADLENGARTLKIIEEVSAGKTPQKTVQPGQATRIMTGAPLPAGADAVVMIERCRIVDADAVRIEDAPRPEQNILRQGREMRVGQVILAQGVRLRPQEIGLLATVGKTQVKVRSAPKVAVVATGDEVVAPAEMPGPGQIRNSNALMLLAQVARAGGVPHNRGIARDRLDSLRPHIAEGLLADILVLSGGVSAGKLDLVPSVLEESGVEAEFHKVAMKPGKPVFFGVKEHDERRSFVFGLPGNPVSAMVCFELFVRPAIQGLLGYPPEIRLVKATLAEDFHYKTDRQTYHPAQLSISEHGWQVRPTPWFGSPDLRGVTAANAFVVFPEGDHHHRAGAVYDVLQVE